MWLFLHQGVGATVSVTGDTQDGEQVAAPHRHAQGVTVNGQVAKKTGDKVAVVRSQDT